MQIHDIVNRDIVNLSNCDEEPIHIPGSIQPHGFLLALDSSASTIKFCSGNIEKHIGLKPADVLQKGPGVFLKEPDSAIFQNHINNKGNLSSTPLVLHISGQKYSCVIHKSDEALDC